ncbi:hypothetical protein SE963_08280 [Escherichia coli]|nr:hypothetical protein [Escherichia coli]
MRTFRQAFRGVNRAKFHQRSSGEAFAGKIPRRGDDFRFGAGREGDFLLLQKAGMEYGFDITSTQTFCEGGVRISSTAVRQALRMTIWLWQKVYWGTRLPSPGV